MKRLIKASSATSEMMNWFRGEEVEKLMRTMTPFEKTIIGKIANNADPANYIGAIADAVDLLKPYISRSFEQFLSQAVEVFRA